MLDLNLKAEIPLAPEIYWKMRSTPEFFALESKVANNKKEMLEDYIDENGIHKQKLSTKLDLEAVPTWLLGSLKDIQFVDHVIFDKEKEYAFSCETKPNIYESSVDIKTKTFLDLTKDKNKSIQNCEAKISINIFGVGSVIEMIIKNGLEQAYSQLPELCLEFQRLHPNWIKENFGNNDDEKQNSSDSSDATADETGDCIEDDEFFEALDSFSSLDLDEKENINVNSRIIIPSDRKINSSLSSVTSLEQYSDDSIKSTKSEQMKPRIRKVKIPQQHHFHHHHHLRVLASSNGTKRVVKQPLSNRHSHTPILSTDSEKDMLKQSKHRRNKSDISALVNIQPETAKKVEMSSRNSESDLTNYNNDNNDNDNNNNNNNSKQDDEDYVITIDLGLTSLWNYFVGEDTESKPATNTNNTQACMAKPYSV